MSNVYKFKSADEKALEEFFEHVASTFEWCDSLVFVSHNKEGEVVVGMLSKDSENINDTMAVGILETAKLSLLLGDD